MTLPDEQIVYSLSLEDIRRVAEKEGLRELTDEEILKVEERLGDEIAWYDHILSSIESVVPGIRELAETDND